MKRRNFLKIASPAVLSPLMLNGLAIQTFSNMNMLACEGISDRVLVLVQLAGGNDAINTIVPINQYDRYRTIRPTIGLSDSGSNAFIPLDSTLPIEDQVGLHPSMTAFKEMYEDGLLNIVQGVSYNNHNRSHFKSTDLFLSGGDGRTENYNISTGWMGRYLDHRFPGIAGNPTPLMPDPLGIQLGDSKPSLGFHTVGEHASAINLSGQNLQGYYNVISELGIPGPANIPSSDYGDEISFILNIQNSVSNYAERITEVFNAGSNALSYPDLKLADQFKTIARLIDGGCMTKVFLVRLSGFDTHNSQVQSGDPHLGNHADLLNDLAESVKAFLADLDALGLGDQVLVSTFSEFGRKPIENGNQGTDHGMQAPMFLFGKSVEPGMTGTNVNLSDLDRDQLINPQHDYRQVFTTILQDWLGAGDDALSAAYFDDYIPQKLPFLKTNFVVPPECYLLTPLPAILTHFHARAYDNEVVELEWETSSELNLKEFEVQRSGDGKKFETINTLSAQGNNNALQEYAMIDENPLLGKSYYRLRQVDFDGQINYSDIRVVDILDQQLGQLRLYPNPATTHTNITITSSGNASDARFRLYDNSGKLMLDEPMLIRKGSNRLRISLSEIPAGYYIAKVESLQRALTPPLPLVIR